MKAASITLLSLFGVSQCACATATEDGSTSSSTATPGSSASAAASGGAPASDPTNTTSVTPTAGMSQASDPLGPQPAASAGTTSGAAGASNTGASGTAASGTAASGAGASGTSASTGTGGTSSVGTSASAGTTDTGTPLDDGPRVIVTGPMGEPVEDSCGIQEFDLERKPPEILLVLDRSASMKDEPNGADGDTSKWELTAPAVTQVIQETDAGLAWGLKLFPVGQDTDACSAETIVDDIHVPVAPMNAVNVVAAVEGTQPEGDGTPTGDAILSATAYLQELALTSNAPKSILLATDGEPSCSPSGEDQGDARPYAIDAVAAALDAGFPTFVVGVNTTKDSATETLNAMAVAGGYPRDAMGADPEEAILYYLANTQAELTDALRAITGIVATCVFTLDPPPPAPNNIAVDFNGMRTPHDPNREEGWDYTSDDFSTVEVFGSYCDQIQNEAQNQVQFLFGCPGEPIPLPT